MSGMPEFGEPVAEALAWRLIAELARRHPDRLWIRTETHSIGSEQAFVLDLQAPERPPLGIFGLPGSAALNWSGTDRMEWRDAYDGLRDPRDWLVDYERMLNLQSPRSGLAPSTGSSLALRTVGQFLVSTLGAREPWMAGGPRRWVRSDALIPKGATWTHDDVRPHPFEPVFVGRRGDDAPAVAFSPDGQAWTDGRAFDLVAEYAAAGSISALLLRILPSAMG